MLTPDLNFLVNPSKEFRPLRYAPKYFVSSDGVNPFGGLLPPTDSPEELQRKQQVEQDRQRQQANQNRQNQNWQRLQNQNQMQQQQQLQNAAHSLDPGAETEDPKHSKDSKRSESAKRTQQQNLELLNQSTQEGIKDEWRDQFRDRDKSKGNRLYQPALPRSTTQNLLQNLNQIHQENNAEQVQEELLTLFRQEQNLPDTGKKLTVSDFNRALGTLREGNWLPKDASGPQKNLLQRYTANQAPRTLAEQALMGQFKPNISAQLFKEVLAQILNNHPQLSDPKVAFALVAQGKLIFLKQDGKLRMLELQEDGSLFEMNPDGQGEALNPEQKKEVIRLLKQQNQGEAFSSDQQGYPDLLASSESAHPLLNQLGVQQGAQTSIQKAKSLEQKYENSSFTKLLGRVLGEKEKLDYPELAQGQQAAFPVKEDWNSFFENMQNLGSYQTHTSLPFDEVQGFIFRGIFLKQESDEETIVSDLLYQTQGKSRSEKFIQLTQLPDSVLDQLDGLSPGQSYSKDILEEEFGSELDFIKLKHRPSQDQDSMGSDVLKNVQFDVSQNVDPYSQARLEHQIFSASKRNQTLEQVALISSPSDQPVLAPGFLASNPMIHFLKEKKIGSFTWLSLLGYTSLGAGFALLIYLLLK